MSNGSKFQDFFSSHAGNFSNHIDTSIPAYRHTIVAMMQTIADDIENSNERKVIIDIGGSDADKGKILAQMTDKDFLYICVDPNPEMYNNFIIENTDSRLLYVNECFGPFTYGSYIGWYPNPSERPDYVISSMIWQFLDSNRLEHYKAAWAVSKDETVFITFEKFLHTSKVIWQLNEDAKNTYKLQFFSQEELDDKAETVLVGMTENMITIGEAYKHLHSLYENVTDIHNSGNFIPVIAGDKNNAIDFSVNFYNHLVDNGGLEILHSIYK